MCDVLVAVGAEAADGVTLFGKNSDRKRGECQPLLQFSEASHPADATVRCSHIEIPQVAETYRVLGHAPWWVWGFEHGVNEHAVAIGNLEVFSNETIEAQPGLIGMDLVRLGLERGRSAREALEVIATLLETRGQGGAGRAPGGGAYHNGFVLADASEAWILETSNRHWAARRTTLGNSSNHIALTDDWEISSRDFESFARGEGWWRNTGRVNAAAAYRNRAVPVSISDRRHRRAQQLLQLGSGHHDVAGFARMLRDHLEVEDVWPPREGEPHTFFATLCAHSSPISWTTASIIAPLPAQTETAWPVWVCFGTPCTGIYLPVYLDGAIPAAFARGGESDAGDDDSAWWVFERLDRKASSDGARHGPVLRDGWAALEASLERERVQVESLANSEIAAGRRDGAAEVLSDFMQRSAEAALQRARELTQRLD
jgi:secernin